MTTAQIDIAANLASVQGAIAAAAKATGRRPQEVTLVAVAKTMPADPIRVALAAGHRAFGENRVQEAEAKWPELREAYPDTELHLIGPLQTNKVKKAVALFEVIETVDRPHLAETLARVLASGGNIRTRKVYIQVNTGAEPQKAGILPEQADTFIEDCVSRLRLPVAGLMCIPPTAEEPALHFAFLREIARRHGIAELSMGMSADYEVAVAFGATHVRVGTAIFGARG